MKYLVDANLPIRIRVFNSPDCISVRDLNLERRDDLIWQHAREHDQIIITKDADFTSFLYRFGPPPGVVHLRIGDLSSKVISRFLIATWPSIEELVSQYFLLEVFVDRIDCSFERS